MVRTLADGIKIRELDAATIVDDTDVFVIDGLDASTPTGTLTQQIKYEDLKTQLITDVGGGGGGAGQPGATGPQGIQGPAGPAGPAGPEGATGPISADVSQDGYTLTSPRASSNPVVLTVTVAAKTANNRYSGSSDCFYINGVEAPTVTLSSGRTYRFDVSAVSNVTFGFYQRGLGGLADYTEGVDNTRPGYVEIEVNDSTRNHLVYDSSTTQDMGGTIDVIGSYSY